MGVSLEFIKEPYVNTNTYRNAIKSNIQMTGTNVDILLDAINKYLLELAKDQIRLAFEQAEKEVTDLHQRTSEGLQTAKLKGKQIGRIKNRKYPSKKEKIVKEIILKNSRDFYGTNTDAEVIKIAGICRNTYYTYKKSLQLELSQVNCDH